MGSAISFLTCVSLLSSSLDRAHDGAIHTSTRDARHSRRDVYKSPENHLPRRFAQRKPVSQTLGIHSSSAQRSMAWRADRECSATAAGTSLHDVIRTNGSPPLGRYALRGNFC